MITKTSGLTFKTHESNEYNEQCFYWMRTLESANLVFCHVEIEERVIERSIEYNTNCILDFNNKINQTSSSEFCHDFVVFTDSRGRDFTEDCISKTIRMEQLYLWTKMIICDKSLETPQHFKEKGSLKFLGSTNALYVTKSDCWSAGPFYILRRSLSPAADCTLWMPDTEVLPDMQGQTVRTVTFDRLLFTVIAKNETDPTERYDGIEIMIFLEVAKMLNFTWEMEEIGDEVTNKWGKLDEDGKWKGGVGEVITTGSADLVLAALWIFDNHVDMDFILSWSSLQLVFLVPRPRLLGSSWANLGRPFQHSLWLSVGVLVLAFPLLAWALERLYMMYDRDHRQSRGSGQLASPRAPDPLQPVVSLWYILVLLLNACYTSKIASFVAIASYEPRLDSVQQLVEQNFSWGRTYYVDTPTKFMQMENYWQRRFVEHYNMYSPSDERELLLSRKFALYAQVLEGSENILVDRAIDDDLIKDLRLMKEGLLEYRITSGVRQHSPLKHFYDRVIVRLFEHGLIMNFKALALRKYQKSSYETFCVDPESSLNSEPTVLALEDVKYVFYILVIGLLLSSVFFVLEIYVHSRSSRRNK